MAIYTMVKNNTFNGVPLPAIMLNDCDGNLKELRRFGYSDFKSRLGCRALRTKCEKVKKVRLHEDAKY